MSKTITKIEINNKPVYDGHFINLNEKHRVCLHDLSVVSKGDDNIKEIQDKFIHALCNLENAYENMKKHWAKN